MPIIATEEQLKYWSKEWLDALNTLNQMYPDIDWWPEYVGMDGASYIYGESADQLTQFTFGVWFDPDIEDNLDINQYSAGNMVLYKATYNQPFDPFNVGAQKQLSNDCILKM